MLIDFIDSLKLMLDREYNMDVVKEFKGTDSFLDMEESRRGCDIDETQKVKHFEFLKNCCYFF